MAIVWSLHQLPPKPFTPIIINPNSPKSFTIDQKLQRSRSLSFCLPDNELDKGSTSQGDDNEDFGVKVALTMLRFYKNEISPLLPKSCRYVPTCSEYSMIAYKKYGVVKGSILTAWRICRCNPLGGSGFDPPRWFDEPSPPEQ
ncbi:UPF0161 protein At3g09310-like [Bidens hawaiensis]|uniref:UPF0161 protein At3g09310-like n=1 Tax=Bidens hawaiensis TaxID=980011 RepID=UPI00404B6453